MNQAVPLQDTLLFFLVGGVGSQRPSRVQSPWPTLRAPVLWDRGRERRLDRVRGSCRCCVLHVWCALFWRQRLTRTYLFHVLKIGGADLTLPHRHSTHGGNDIKGVQLTAFGRAASLADGSVRLRAASWWLLTQLVRGRKSAEAQTAF